MYSTAILFFILAGCAVKSDDASNYFVVQMPDEVYQKETINKKTLQVYWNVPSIQCKSKRIPFEKLYEKYGIVQNSLDTFRGDRVSIMYDPGYFPAIFKNASTGELVLRNGGVPQEGNLEFHMKQFEKDVEHQIEDPGFDGVGIIDFESWRPIFRQNFGTLEPYQKLSYDIERQKHWWWPSEWIKSEAAKRFEEAAQGFMQNTLSLAKKLRPKARWGYYGFPYCFNNPPSVVTCAKQTYDENNRLDWLWSESTALYPSIYSTVSLTTPKLSAFIKARVGEAARVARGATPILPYWWFRYRDAGYFTQTDLNMALQTLYRSSASGFIIWGSSSDVNTQDKCHNLLNYIDDGLGPSVVKYTRADKVAELDTLELFNDDGNSTFVVTNKPIKVESVSEGIISTINIEPNINANKNEIKIGTQSEFHPITVGEIGVLTSTTEAGFYASEDKEQKKRTTENVVTTSPIIRILTIFKDTDVTTKVPTKEIESAKEFSTVKEDLSTKSVTVKSDYKMESTTLIEKDYEENNTTNDENEESIFNEEIFFDDADFFSNDDDITTSTAQGTTDETELSIVTKDKNTANITTATESIESRSAESRLNDEKGTVAKETNKGKNEEYILKVSTVQFNTNILHTTEGTSEQRTNRFNTHQESTPESAMISQNQHLSTILDKAVETTSIADKIVTSFLEKVTEHSTTIIAIEKTKIRQDWSKTLFNDDEETNETFEDNETAVLVGDPTSMGLTSGVEKVSRSTSAESLGGRSKHFICFFFYFYSLSRCLCDLYGQC